MVGISTSDVPLAARYSTGSIADNQYMLASSMNGLPTVLRGTESSGYKPTSTCKAAPALFMSPGSSPHLCLRALDISVLVCLSVLASVLYLDVAHIKFIYFLY